ncbi:MAG TPA: hypothetical protein VEC76_07740 [Streptosporangiaceae bacterium]|nr:hypothetical protein [Streptosporangiaceae bacterium]
MKRLRTGLAVAAMALVLGPVAAGCSAASSAGGAIKSAVASVTASASITLPTTEAPTVVPTTPEPTTVSTTVTVAPTTAAQAPTTAPASDSGSSLLWLWIVLGALVLIGIITWIARASGRRSAAASGWRSAVVDTYARGQALADAVRMADTAGAADAAGQWAGLQARADELAQELYRLRERAPGEEDRMQVEDTLVSLRGLRSAMADEQAAGGAGGPGSPEASQVRGRLAAFEQALRALRAAHEPTPRI